MLKDESCQTFRSIEALKSAGEDKPFYILASGQSVDGSFFYQTDNAPYEDDGINVIKLDNIDLSVGALVRQSSSSISHKPSPQARSRSVQEKLSETTSVTDFGARGDGQSNDREAIVAALASDAGTVNFPIGTYAIDAPIEVNGAKALHFEAGAKIMVMRGVREGLQFGKSALFTGTVSGNPVIEKARYEGDRIEDVGIAYYNCASATFHDLDARNFRFPHRLKPQVNQRVGYSVWHHIQGSRGYHNLSFDPEATGYPGKTGFINENTFFMGRMFGVAGRTARHVSAEVGNHNRFIAICAESPGGKIMAAGFYIGGHSNLVESPRTEGRYQDAGVVLTSDSQRCAVRAWNFYTDVIDRGIGNSVETSGSGVRITNPNFVGTAFDWGRTTGGNGAPAVRFRALATSRDDYGFEQRLGRFTDSSFHFKYVRDSDDLIAFSGDAKGNFYASRKIRTGRSDFAAGGLQLDSYNIWFASDRSMRVKEGTPSSDRDGDIIMRMVDVPSSSSENGKPGDIAVSNNFIYIYAGNGKRHKWTRIPTEAW